MKRNKKNEKLYSLEITFSDGDFFNFLTKQDIFKGGEKFESNLLLEIVAGEETLKFANYLFEVGAITELSSRLIREGELLLEMELI